MSFAGHAANSNGCVARPKGRETGLTGYAGLIQRSLPIGSSVMETAEHREPCEPRGSRTVLGAPGGEIPPGDSTKPEVSQGRGNVRFRGQSRPQFRAAGCLFIAISGSWPLPCCTSTNLRISGNLTQAWHRISRPSQLTYRESLRDIEACLRAQNSELYHMGIRGNVSRSTLMPFRLGKAAVRRQDPSGSTGI